MQPQQKVTEISHLWERLVAVNWKSRLFDFAFIPLAALVALNVNAEAVRIMAPGTARKIVQLKLLHIPIDTASIIAVIFLCCVFWATIQALKVIRLGVSDKVKNPQFDYWLPIISAVTLLLADLLMFYSGLSHQSLFASKIQKIPMLISAGYTGATVFLAFFSQKLKEE